MPTLEDIKKLPFYYENLTTQDDTKNFILINRLSLYSTFLTPTSSDFFIAVVYIDKHPTEHTIRCNFALIPTYTEEPNEKHYQAFAKLTNKSRDDFYIDLLFENLNPSLKMDWFLTQIENLIYRKSDRKIYNRNQKKPWISWISLAPIEISPTAVMKGEQKSDIPSPIESKETKENLCRARIMTFAPLNIKPAIKVGTLVSDKKSTLPRIV